MEDHECSPKIGLTVSKKLCLALGCEDVSKPDSGGGVVGCNDFLYQSSEKLRRGNLWCF